RRSATGRRWPTCRWRRTTNRSAERSVRRTRVPRYGLGLLGPVLLVALTVLGVGGTRSVEAQSSPFEGKTIRIVVGFAPGGGFDTYARVISRHMGKHIPGNPTIVVDNQPGAGSLIAANQLSRVVKPDGLTIGHLNGGLFLGQVLGQPGIEFDARKFELIGA